MVNAVPGVLRLLVGHGRVGRLVLRGRLTFALFFRHANAKKNRHSVANKKRSVVQGWIRVGRGHPVRALVARVCIRLG